MLSPTSDEAAGPSGANADEKGKQTSGSSPSSSSTAKPHPKDTSPTEKAISRHTTAAAAAMSELRALEALYLLLTAVLPMLATYLLHAIRARLTRPSGGLVSNYNLAIFLLAAELRPLSHAMALLHARTLHLQRVVAEGETSIARATEATAGSGRGRVDGDALAPLLARLEALEKAQAEARAEAAAVAVRGSGSVDTDTGSVSASRYLAKQSQQPTKKPSFGDDPVVLASITRQVRAALQPDVDAIARATRRYEKKAAVLAYQTETRLRDLDARVDDAVALAAAAATGGASGRSRGRARLGLLPTVWLLALLRAMGLAMLWLLSAAWAVICIPFRAAYNVLIALPAHSLVSLLSGGPERRRMRRRMRAAAAAAEKEKEKERERAGKRSGGSVPVPGASSTAGGAFTVAPLTRSASGRRVAGWPGENENSPSRIR